MVLSFSVCFLEFLDITLCCRPYFSGTLELLAPLFFFSAQPVCFLFDRLLLELSCTRKVWLRSVCLEFGADVFELWSLNSMWKHETSS